MPKTKKLCLQPFLRGLLDDPSKSDIIRWTDKSKMEFRFVDQHKVAEIWGATKPGRKAKMTYDNMCKSLRKFCKDRDGLEKVEGRLCSWRFLDSSIDSQSDTFTSSVATPNDKNKESPPFSIDRILFSDSGSSGSSSASPSKNITMDWFRIAHQMNFQYFTNLIAQYQMLQASSPEVQLDINPSL
ncbi:Protein CBG00794 [Caenorhabditis briggsae]|uniref:Protein CBG00794 n=1 Tax=Caenorhabditis briggsae TaxID=6238 RepID=A8WNU5_CAEBR|nr:Protein CBG00794 [Caenorhabditis briggsae]CAP22151.1 Protein CBG00794 [Caenorhabditis briggsae]